MYLTYTELKTINPSTSITAEEWPSMAFQIDAWVDRETFGVIPERGVMDIPTLAERVKRAVALQAEEISNAGGVQKGGEDARVVSRSVNVGGISESVTYATGTSTLGDEYAFPVSAAALSMLAKIIALGRQIGGGNW